MFIVALSHGKITNVFLFSPFVFMCSEFSFQKGYIYPLIKINLFPVRRKQIKKKESSPYENTQPDFLISHIVLSTYYSYVFYNSQSSILFWWIKLSNHFLICGSVYHGVVPLGKVWRSRSRPTGGPGVRQQPRQLPGSQALRLPAKSSLWAVSRAALPQALAGGVLENATGSFSEGNSFCVLVPNRFIVSTTWVGFLESLSPTLVLKSSPINLQSG